MKPLKKSTEKRWGWLIAGFLLLVAFIFYNVRKHKFIKDELPEVVATKTDNLYSVHYDSIAVNEIAGELYIKNLYIKGDTLKQQQLITSNSPAASKVLFNIYIPSLRISGFKTAKALLSKSIVCDKVIITDLKIVAFVYDINKRQNIKKQSEEVYRQLLGNLEQIKANKVEVNNAELIVKDFNSGKLLIEATKTSIAMIDVNVDSAHHDDAERILFSRKMLVTAGDLVIHNEQTAIKFNGVDFDSETEKFSIKSGRFADPGGNSVSVSNIYAEGLDLGGAVEETHLLIDSVLIQKISVQAAKKEKQKSNVAAQPTKPVLPKWLNKLRVNIVRADDVSYKQINKLGKDGLRLDGSKIEIKGIDLDSSSSTTQSALKFFKEVNITNNLITLKTNDNLYTYSFAGVRLNTAAQNIAFKEIKIKPLLGEEEFARRAKVQADRYEGRIRNLAFNGVDFEKLLQGALHAKSVETSNSILNVYRDISYPLNMEKRLDIYPNQMILEMEFPVIIDRLHAKNTYIAYKEKNALSNSSGTVSFEHTDLVIDNITNQLTGAKQISEWNFTSRLLNIIPIKVNIQIDLNNYKKGNFVLTGTVESSNAKVLNPLTQPMSLIKIDEGTIHKVNVAFEGDSALAIGKLHMVYDDLKISMLKKKGDKLQKKGVTSVLANLLIKRSNTKNPGEQNTNINYQRNPNKSFFNFIWKSTFSGILDIVK